jgi:glycyl-tRNA synthetase beta chain
MSNFLLEILSEEIPALMQKSAAENFAKIANEVLLKNGLVFENSQIKTFITPCRLSLKIEGLKDVQKISALKKFGPKITADKKAIEGFLKSVSLMNESDLQQADGIYIFVKPESEAKTIEIIKNSLPQIVQKMTNSWSKLMRWNVEENIIQPKWIRPVRNILCLFDCKIVECEFFALKANNKTFVRGVELEIKDAAEYEKSLAQNFVILDQIARKKKILEQISKIKTDLSCDLVIDEERSNLVDEVVGLCEFPTSCLAKIDEKFLDLPDEVLILTLQINQKYFCLRDKLGKLLPKFIFVSNAVINELNHKKIIHDNEKLVRARLADAEFFIAEDLKKPLNSRFEDLKKIVFHQKLGSVYDKTNRLKNLTQFLSIFIPHCDLSLAQKASQLCKADLNTKIVAELPELQGKIGSFYAHKQNEDKKIIAAIYEHYLPLGLASELPNTPLGIALSIADKIDSIVGFFLADEKPTSSKDPFALRRAVLGIVRIGFYHNIAFPIRILIERAFNAYPAKLSKTLLDTKERNFHDGKKLLIEEVIRFFVERLKAYLKENESLRSDIISLVIDEYLSDLDAHKYVDILYLAKKIKFLDEFIKNDKYQNLISLYKRSANILAIEEKKDGKKYNAKPSLLSFKTKYEIVLYRRIKQIKTDFKKMIIKGEFSLAFSLLEVLELPLSQFFDHVIVNDENKDLRENRLLLLSQISSLFKLAGDLARVIN